MNLGFQIRDSVFGHEYLSCRLPVLRKEFLINHHELDLADRRAGLFLLQGPALFYAHCRAAHRNCTRRDKYHIFALIMQISDFSRENFKLREIQSAGLLVDQRGRSQLDHDPFSVL